MAQTAIALARKGHRWIGQEIDPGEVEDLDGFADALRDLGGDIALGFVEEDDEYLGIVRVDGDDDPRVFVSDRRMIDTSDLANRLFEDTLPLSAQTEDDEEGTLPEADPAGDVELLADLGTPGDVLVELLAEEGMLPADVVSEVCERAGCLDVLDEVRGS